MSIRSSGYGRRLIFWKLWVWILALYTGWTFFMLICCKKYNICLKKSKKYKRDRYGPFPHYYPTVFFCQFCRVQQKQFFVVNVPVGSALEGLPSLSIWCNGWWSNWNVKHNFVNSFFKTQICNLQSRRCKSF